MKTKITTCMVLWFTVFCHNQVAGQGQKENKLGATTFAGEVEDKFHSTISDVVNNNNQNPARTDITVDFSSDPRLKMAFLFKTWNVTDNAGIKILGNAELGSSNKYVPILSKGKWAPDFSGGLTLTGYRNINYEFISNPGAISKSYLHRGTLQLNYNYKEYFTLKDSLYFGIEELFNSTRKSDFNLGATYDFYAKPSYNKLPDLTILITLGYKLLLNGSNYEDLDEVKVNQFQTFTDTLGRTVQVNYPETPGRKGKLSFSTGHILFAEVHCINQINNGLAIDGFANGTLLYAAKDAMFNLKAGVNFAITNKGDKSVVNIAPVVVFKDLTEKFNDNNDIKKRIVPGIQLGIPIPQLSANNNRKFL